jgi:hypothetical protein
MKLIRGTPFHPPKHKSSTHRTTPYADAEYGSEQRCFYSWYERALRFAIPRLPSATQPHCIFFGVQPGTSTRVRYCTVPTFNVVDRQPPVEWTEPPRRARLPKNKPLYHHSAVYTWAKPTDCATNLVLSPPSLATRFLNWMAPSRSRRVRNQAMLTAGPLRTWVPTQP